MPRTGSVPSPRLGVCDPRTFQGRPEGFTARAGGRTHRQGALVHKTLSALCRGEPHPTGHPGNRAGGAGLAVGAAERGRIGVLEKGKQGTPARASGQRVVFGGAGRAQHETWPCQREGALAAGCQGQGPARKWVRLAAPPTPIILGRRARPQTSPGLRGDPIPSVSCSETRGPSQSPTGRAPISRTSDCSSPPARVLPPPVADRCALGPQSPSPTVGPPQPRTPPPYRPGHASPGGCKFALLRAS